MPTNKKSPLAKATSGLRGRHAKIAAAETQALNPTKPKNVAPTPKLGAKPLGVKPAKKHVDARAAAIAKQQAADRKAIAEMKKKKSAQRRS